MLQENRSRLFIWLANMGGLAYLCLPVGLSLGEPMEMKKPTANELSIMIETDKATYRVGETVQLHCVFQNMGQVALKLRQLLKDEPAIYLGKNGQETPLYPKQDIFIRELIREEAIVTLAPKATHRFTRPITSERYLLPSPGSYSLYVVYENRSQKVGKTKVWVGRIKSNSVKIQVIP